jgi:eukaryotic-like serine/threonine-protein kinase
MPADGDLLGGRYRILGTLGAGGMATVHRAHDERLRRDVAVKVLLPNHARDPALAERFEREAFALATAGHPGIVAVYDVDPGKPGRREPFFVMELCPGGSLAVLLAGERPIRPDELVPIILSVADGLASLHARGIVHRDVKPSNILLSPSRAKLADFGLARSSAAAEVSDLTAAGTAVGTLPYLAPELLGGAPATSASDVYALGVAAFVGLTGSLPRPAGSMTELVTAAAAPAPLASAVAPDLGTAFDGVLAQALDGDPAKRPDAVTFGAGLTSALGAWTRAGPHRAARAAPEPPVIAEATTSLAVATTPEPADWSAGTAPTGVDVVDGATPVPAARATTGGAGAARPRWGIGPGLVALALLAIAALWAVAIAATVLRPGGGTALSSPSSSAVTAGAPSVAQSTAPPSATATAEPTPSPTPRPTPTPSVVARAGAALDEVFAAIAAARGSGGLKGKEANELDRLAGAVRSALGDGDIEEAQGAAEKLQEKADSLGREIDAGPERRLDQAIANLRSVLGED